MRVLAAIAVMLILAVPAHATSCRRPSSTQIASLPSQYPSFYRALRADFGSHWVEAATVSYGEGSWHFWAANGQYKGTFQMGSHERSVYGDGVTLADQSHAAARYWRNGGWSHWDCQPY